MYGQLPKYTQKCVNNNVDVCILISQLCCRRTKPLLDVRREKSSKREKISFRLLKKAPINSFRRPTRAAIDRPSNGRRPFYGQLDHLGQPVSISTLDQRQALRHSSPASSDPICLFIVFRLLPTKKKERMRSHWVCGPLNQKAAECPDSKPDVAFPPTFADLFDSLGSAASDSHRDKIRGRHFAITM